MHSLKDFITCVQNLDATETLNTLIHLHSLTLYPEVSAWKYRGISGTELKHCRVRPLYHPIPDLQIKLNELSVIYICKSFDKGENTLLKQNFALYLLKEETKTNLVCHLNLAV